MTSRFPRVWTALSALGLAAMTGAAEAAPKLRVQVDQQGDFLLIGNTLAHDCANGVPAPVVGSVGSCGNNTGDTAPDVFWRSDEPGAGQATASTSITVQNARSTSLLALPPGAEVTHAYLYWGARVAASADAQARVEREGVFGQNMTAIESYTATNQTYVSVADVTALVQTHGAGAYRVGEVDTQNLNNQNEQVSFSAWWMVVLYKRPLEPLRNLAIFDGLDPVQNNSPQNTTLSGFLVPSSGYTAKLGLVALEGDSSVNGDQFSFGGASLSDAQNPVDNFFNGTRSTLGAPVSVPGDLPQLAGTPGSMSGIDIDVVDVTSNISGGQTSVNLTASSSGDTYYLSTFITSITTFRPDFSSTTKSAADVNGGLLLPGDVIEYTITATNSGNDVATDVLLTDVLPVGVTFVPGSLQIAAGANAGAKTDDAGDDQGEYNAATRTVTFSLGTGGEMGVTDTATVKFQVTVDPGLSGAINNQATVTSKGKLGGGSQAATTDGNGNGAGSPPTPVFVDQCETNAQCAAPSSVCDTSVDPNVCVGCLADSDCGGTAPVCNTGSKGCTPCNGNGQCGPKGICNPDGSCDADNDDDGVVDSADNCPALSNPDQLDTDGDKLGNACDDDDDGDGVDDAIDSCPLVANADQLDTNGDKAGDACDDDDDGDTILDGADNCPLVANTDQADADKDGIGDACAADIDGDGVPNGIDSCPLVANADQLDTDGDKAGDACDDDDDGDTVLDQNDNCPLDANPDQKDLDKDGLGAACDPDDGKGGQGGMSGSSGQGGAGQAGKGGAAGEGGSGGKGGAAGKGGSAGKGGAAGSGGAAGKGGAGGAGQAGAGGAGKGGAGQAGAGGAGQAGAGQGGKNPAGAPQADDTELSAEGSGCNSARGSGAGGWWPLLLGLLASRRRARR